MARPNKVSTPSLRAKASPRKKTAGKSGKSKPLSPETYDTAFVEALSADFLRHGASAIVRLREDEPVTYMKLCASVLPKAVIDSVDPLDSLTDEELHERARRLAEKAGFRLHPRPDGAGAKNE